MEPPDPLEDQDGMVYLDCLVLKETWVPWDLQDLLEVLEALEDLEDLDLKVNLDSQVEMVFQVLLV